MRSENRTSVKLGSRLEEYQNREVSTGHESVPGAAIFALKVKLRGEGREIEKVMR